MDKLTNKVFNILKDVPIDVLDEETDLLMSSDKWLLSEDRENGHGNRIGVLNIWLVCLVLAKKYDTSIDNKKVLDSLTNICNNLVDEGLLKVSPAYTREQFKLITNEELDAKRKERDSTD